MRYEHQPGFLCGHVASLDLSEAPPLLPIIGRIKRSYFWCGDAYNLEHLASLTPSLRAAMTAVESVARTHASLKELRVRERGYDNIPKATLVPQTFNKRRIDREAHKVIALASGRIKLTNPNGSVVVEPLAVWALDNVTPADIVVDAGTIGVCLYFGAPEVDHVPIWELYK